MLKWIKFQYPDAEDKLCTFVNQKKVRVVAVTENYTPMTLPHILTLFYE